jgi:hypothetical protein
MSLIRDITIDAFTCVIQGLTQECMKNIHRSFDNISASISSEHWLHNDRLVFASRGYNRCIRIPLGKNDNNEHCDQKYMTLYIDPTDHKKAFVRFELNKHPYELMHYMLVKQYLDTLFRSCEINYLQAKFMRVTRIDIAIDKEISLRNLWFNRNRSQCSMIVHNRKGVLETVYLGDKRSEIKVRIYDKVAQLKSRRHKHNEYHSLLRVEFCFKPNCKINETFQCIDLPGQLEGFCIYKAKAIKSAKILSDEVFSLIEHVGIKSILQSMHQSDRRQILKQLEPFKTQFVSVKRLNSNKQKLENELGLLFNN